MMGLFGDADLKQLRTVLTYLSMMQRMKAENHDLYLSTVGTEEDGDAAREESRREAIGLINRLVSKGKGEQAKTAINRSGFGGADGQANADWTTTMHSIEEESNLE